MTSQELQQLLQCEDDRVEWKLSLKVKSDDVLQAVCALANDLGHTRRPGYLIIGVNPKTGRPEGLGPRNSTLDEEQQRLVSQLSNVRLWPKPAFDVQIEELEGKTLLLIRVDPFEVPPAVTVDGVAWVRRGPTTCRATEADMIRLKERRPLKNQPFDIRPWPGATLDALDRNVLQMRYQAAREEVDDDDEFPTLEHWLTQMQLGSFVQETWTPNAAAILMYGKSPQFFFPCATIEFVRYSGTDVDASVTWRKTITGALPEQLETLWVQLSAHIAQVPIESAGIRSPYVYEYPLEALKELGRNLVQHRLYEHTNAPGRVEWYDDRIEFSNPGGPFNQASEDEFGDHWDYRNPSITLWLKLLGHVEQLGRGIRRVRKLLQKNGNPPLAVEKNGFTRVIVRRVP